MSGSDGSDDEFEDETPHERHIRLTKKALAEALKIVGSDEEDATATLSLRLQEQALQARGKLFVKVADKFKPISMDSILFLRGHKKSVYCLCISSDCEYLYSGGKDAAICKWDLKDFRKIKLVSGGRRGSSSSFHTGPILSIAISDDRKYLASGSADMSIIIWAPDNLDVLYRLRRHFSPVTALSFRRQSHMMFSGDRSGRVCVWNMPLTEALQDQGAATKIEVLSICGLSAERFVSSSGFGGAGVCLWKVEEEVCVQYTVKNPLEHSVECVYAVNDDLFVGGSTSNTLYLWHTSRGSPISKVCPAHPPMIKEMESATARPAVNWVTTVSGLFGTDLIASGSSSGHIQLWRLVVEGKAFSFGRDGDGSDGENVKANSRGRLRVHHDNAKIVRIPGGEFYLGGYVNSLAFSNDGTWLVAGIGQEHRLGRWEERRKVNDVVCLIPISIPFKLTPEVWVQKTCQIVQ
ncbi:U3 small nucleolar RNA-interacting protein 2 [Taenia crassiceps]|uniref:U3 small nucleolar RNA-interacting protein 2 n=1 Tax=Taenia crassiceps TaxID=6207 RepID=A0ABR4QKT4_9CEST